MRGPTICGVVLGAVVFAGSIDATTAYAGCGCDKPPPPPAAVRPAFASPGQEIALFGSSISAGDRYVVTFASSRKKATVVATAALRRDLADGVVKPQLVVGVPSLPLGPAGIEVDRKGNRVLEIDEDDFTVLQKPMPLPESDGETVASCYRAAVGADGTVYFPFDVGSIDEHMIFSGLAMQYPLLFGAQDVAIYNTQGFLMQLLMPADDGVLFSISDPGTPHSLELTYDRHEFETYKSEHLHQGDLALDPSDPAWHVDGTPHVDHDNLVIAISGVLENGNAPSPGATSTFDLSVLTALVEGDTSLSRNVMVWSSECSPGA